MKVSLIGHLGYVGQNIKDALYNAGIEQINLIDRKSDTKDTLRYITESNVFIHCAAIQRPTINSIESFLPNYELTQHIVNNLPESAKLIFVSSIHYNSETPFGVVRRMEEDYIKENVKCHTIYHLPYTFGAHGKPNYNNVFNTYIINVINGKEILMNDFKRSFPLLSISYFANKMVSNLSKCLNVVDDFDTQDVTLPDFLAHLSRIHRGIDVDSSFLNDLKNVYEWYRGQ